MGDDSERRSEDRGVSAALATIDGKIDNLSDRIDFGDRTSQQLIDLLKERVAGIDQRTHDRIGAVEQRTSTAMTTLSENTTTAMAGLAESLKQTQATLRRLAYMVLGFILTAVGSIVAGYVLLLAQHHSK